MTKTIEELRHTVTTENAARVVGIDRCAAALAPIEASGGDISAAEKAHYAAHVDPHTDAEFTAAHAIFAIPATTLRDFAMKVSVAFRDDAEPYETERESLVADATRFIEATAARTATDSPVTLVKEWQATQAKWQATAKALLPMDAEGPEIEAIEAKRENLSDRIADSTPTTQADCAALIQWVLESGEDGSFAYPQHAIVQRKVAAFLAGASTTPTPACVEPTSPILTLFHQNRALIAAADKHATTVEGKDVDAELERLFYKEADRISDEMMALPCHTPADFAAKVIVETARGRVFGEWETDPLWAEARALTGGSV